MHRRSWLKLGLASAALLAIGGGTLALLQPGLENARLTAGGRLVFAHVGRALLEGSLPAERSAQEAELNALLVRIDALVSGLPPHAQGELSQLLALLASDPGRRTLAGLSVPWSNADAVDIQSALQSMRTSSLSLRQQAYHALHDITFGAYFSHASTWKLLGYPGPMKL